MNNGFDNNQNNGFESKNGNSYNPYTDFNGNPINFQPIPQKDGNASSSQTLGIIGLIVSIVCCQLAGIIMGIIAITKANASRTNLGFELPEAKTGRICGIIAIVIGIGSVVASILVYVFSFAAAGGLDAILESYYSELNFISALLPR